MTVHKGPTHVPEMTRAVRTLNLGGQPRAWVSLPAWLPKK
jgi:hypothetical protein